MTNVATHSNTPPPHNEPHTRVGALVSRRPAVTLAVLVLVTFPLAACSSGPRNFFNENDRLRKENARLLQQVEELQRNIELRLAEIKQLESQSPNAPAIEGASVPRAVELKFDRHSGAIDTNGDGTDDTLRVYVRPLDQRGRFIVVAGRMSLQAVAITPGQQPALLIDRVFTPAEIDAAYRSGLTGTHYTLEAPLPNPLPDGVNEVTVKITFTDAADGAVITAETPTKLRRKP